MYNEYIMKMFGLDGKTAVVTGGHRGLGASIAKGLASAGANVVIMDICSEMEAKNVLDELKELGSEAMFVQIDLTHKDQLEAAVQKTIDRYNTIDILVNNAGIATTAKSENLTQEDFNHVLNVNLNGTLYACQLVGKEMIKQRYGRIINISSYWGITGNPGGLSYSVAKGGVISLTKVLAAEWGEHNITVNAIAPGYIHTEMTKWVWDNNEISAYITDRIPLENRLGKPEEVAGLVNFLSSNASSYVTGTLIPIDGGLLIQAGKGEWFLS